MNNKIINIYELIGLIKDNKAPIQIQYDGYLWNFDKEDNDYYSSDIDDLLFDKYIKNSIFEYLNDKVKILNEENDAWENVENIDNSSDDTLLTMECYTGIPEKAQDWNFNILKKKINQLIKNQKYLKKKMERNKKSTEFHVETDMYGSAYVADEYGNPYRSKITETEKTC